MKKAKELTGYDNTFAERFRGLMSEKGTKQATLATYLGVTRQAISTYADGSVIPNAENLKKICLFFDVPSDYLLGLTNSKNKEIFMRQITDKTGLSTSAIENLESLCKEKEISTIPPILIIDYMLSNEEYMQNFPWAVISYYITKTYAENKFDTSAKDYYYSEFNTESVEFKRYLLLNRIFRVVDNFCNNYKNSFVKNSVLSIGKESIENGKENE